MEVILLERVEKLGAIGDVVTVKNGFARNYLLPNKKALRANQANRKVFEANRARSPEEADLQAQGIDVLSQMFEEEAAPVVAEELIGAADLVEATGDPTA